MANLDDLKALERLDEKLMRTHIAELPNQVLSAWEQYRTVTVPTHYVQASSITLLAMGDSATASHLVGALATSSRGCPIQVWQGYGVPNEVGKGSLVIAVSYSGNSEEVVDGFLEAAGRGAKLLTITSGGQLASLSRKFQTPMLTIDYGSTTRAAFGYLVTALGATLTRLRHLELNDREVKETVVLMQALSGKLQPEIPKEENQAKLLADKLKDRIPYIIGSESVWPAARRWKTQFNQNGRLVAFDDQLPEMTHNSSTAFDRIYRQRDHLHALFLQSTFAHPRIKLRLEIIQKLFAQQKITADTIVMHPSGTPFCESLLLCLLGDYISLYLALQANVDPSTNLLEDQFQQGLDQHPWEPGS